MEIRIGVRDSNRELSFESDKDSAEIMRQLAETSEMVTFTDTKGRNFVINRSMINYVEIGSDTARKVGFVA